MKIEEWKDKIRYSEDARFISSKMGDVAIEHFIEICEEVIHQVQAETAMEVINDIPEHLEYYREIATPNKLKNNWDMTKLKQQLTSKHTRLLKELKQ
jgi:hypothetical protein